MKRITSLTLGLLLVSGAFARNVAPTTGPGIIQLSELEGVENITALDGETVRLNKSTGNNPITLLGTVYESGIGTHAPSVVVIDLKGATSFYTLIGVDDEADLKPNHGDVDFTVTAYGATASDVTSIAGGHLDRQNN
ncbi:MAG: NPCBM/NEW2 domain-containing protein, partial [Muribaculaceae bacterium]|nr:NPCBM/NEW2 domain-containing protein [Muribaculaceae bacterium]